MPITIWTRTDEQVVRRVLAGRRNDFGILVRRHLPAVLAVAQGHLSGTADVDDVAQESFLAAYQKLDTLRAPEKFASWLMMIVRNTALNWRRQHAREVPLDDGVTQALYQDETPLDRKEMQQMLHHTLMELAADTREVLLMHYYGGCSLREIAQATGISRDAAAKRLQRAREALGAEFLKLVPEARTTSDLKRRAKTITAAVIAAGATWRAVPAYGAVAGLAIGAAKLAGVMAGILALLTGAFFAAPSVLGWEPVFSAEKKAETPAALSKKETNIAVGSGTVVTPALLEGAREPAGQFTFSSILVTPLSQPVGGAEVAVERVTWDATEIPPVDTEKWTVIADPYGSFSVNGLPPGIYSIRAVTRLLGGASMMSISKAGEVRKKRDIKMYPFIRSYGVLVDTHGKAITGAVIYPVAHSFFAGEEFDHVTVGGLRAKTDDQGRFKFWGLIPGGWKFYIVSPNHAPFYTGYVPCYGLRSTVVMEDPGLLTVRVLDSAGQPVANISGSVHTEKLVYRELNGSEGHYSYGIEFPFTSDDNGQFTLDTLSPGKWFFSVNDNTLALKNPQVSVQVEGKGPVEVDLVVTEGGILAGRVLNKKTGAPISGMKVSLSAGGNNLNVNENMVTGEDGHYVFSGLPAGDFALSAAAGREYEPDRYKTVHVETGATVDNHDLLLAPAFMVRGRVLDSGGRPAVARVSANGQGQYDQTRTDENGSFALALREPGSADDLHGGETAADEVRLIAASEKAASEEMPINLTALNGKEIVLRLTGATGGSVEGVVLDVQDKPVCNAQIGVSREDRAAMPPLGEGSRLTTDGTGRFLVTGLAQGRYTLFASMPYGAHLGSAIASVADGRVTRDVVIKNMPAGTLTIEGTLCGPNHLPAPMAMLVLGSGQTTTAGPMGGFEFKGLPEGSQTLFAAVPGYSPLTMTNVAAGTKGLRLFLKKNARLAGTVMDARTRRPVTEFTVNFSKTIQFPFDVNGIGEGSRVVSDAQGRFSIDDVPALAMRVTVKAPGYAPWSTDLAEPESGGELSVVAELEAAAAVAGVVRNDSGEPVSGARVGGVATANDGTFLLEDLAQGQTVTLPVSHDDFASTVITAVAGDGQPVEVVLHPAGLVRVRALLNGQQVPCTFATVRGLESDTVGGMQARYLGTGEMVIVGLAPGTAEVTTFAESQGVHLIGHAVVSIVAGQEIALEVPVQPVMEPAGDAAEGGG